MILNKITKGERKADVTLVFDNGRTEQVLNDIAIKKMLKEGMLLTEQQLEQILDQNQLLNIMKKGYEYLSYGDITERRMRDKLRRHGALEEHIDQCIEHFKDKGYLNDERYAQRYSSLAAENKMWGKRRIIDELFRRGIDLQLARQVVDELEVDWQENAVRLIDEKYSLVNVGSPRQKQKLFNALVRLGYTYDEITTAINQYFYEM